MQSVYLIHLDRKLGHSQHYIGWALSLKARIAHHRKGNGSVFLRAVNEAGIGWEVVRVWIDKSRQFERQIKNYKSAKRFCPICNPKHYQNAGLLKRNSPSNQK